MKVKPKRQYTERFLFHPAFIQLHEEFGGGKRILFFLDADNRPQRVLESVNEVPYISRPNA